MDTPSTTPTSASTKPITIYSTPVCTYCKMAKEYFKEHNINYVEHNVAADAEKRTEMIDKSGQMGVPVIEVGDNILIGFDKEALEELIAKK